MRLRFETASFIPTLSKSDAGLSQKSRVAIVGTSSCQVVTGASIISRGMSELLSLKVLQYFLLPLSAMLGICLGIWLPRTGIAQRRAVSVFCFALVIELGLFNLTYLIGGRVWTRIVFAFTMGFIAFGVRLLK
ncbi:MAG: hypothetical protein AB1489_27315 [Acidobacteriota bacterium]